MSLHVTRSGTGQDLVLLHGWGLHSGAWDEVRPALEQRFRVHAIDLPGHGGSANEPVGNFASCAARVAALTPVDAVLCGWSLGGLVAQHIAATGAPLRALALVATTPCFTTRDDWPHAMKHATLEQFAQGLHRDRDRTLRDFVHLNALNGSRARESIRTFTRHLAERPAPPVEALETTLAWLRDTDLRAQAPAIDCPAAIVHGARDALAPIEAGRWLARAIPRASLVELADAAHLPFFTHREAFVATLESLVA